MATKTKAKLSLIIAFVVLVIGMTVFAAMAQPEDERFETYLFGGLCAFFGVLYAVKTVKAAVNVTNNKIDFGTGNKLDGVDLNIDQSRKDK